MTIPSSAADGHPSDHDDNPIHRKMHSETDYLDSPLQIVGVDLFKML